jgi:site-specific DNA-methyltransferase (adenine-specific)
MEIIMKGMDDIHPYEKNPRKNDAAVKYVAESIKQFGFKVPIVIDGEGVIVAGHTRYKAAKKLKMKAVPCIVADDLNEEQIKAFRLADNKVSEKAEWDFDLLADEIDDLFDFDMTVFGFDEMATDEETEADEDDFDGELPEEPNAQPGDIYQLGNHRLMCGSATSFEDVDALLNGASIDLIYTDPPYGMSAVSKSGVLSEKYKTDIMNDGDNTVAMDSFNLCMTKFHDVKQVWWGANYYTECLPSSECWIVWDKNNGSSDQTDCELAWANFRSVVRQFTMASEKKNRVHPTQKPCKLFSEVVNKFDKNHEFTNVLDLFGGSGSTLIACEQMGKTCYTLELDPKFIDVIIARWEQYTGKKAVLLNGELQHVSAG